MGTQSDFRLLLKSMEKKRFTRRQFVKYGSLMAGGTLTKFGFLDSMGIEVDVVTIPIQDLPPAFDGYRIGIVSDTHYPRGSTAETIRTALRLIMDQKPDVLVIPGDLVQTQFVDQKLDLTSVFGSADAPDGVFGVLGNHDHWVGATEVRRMINTQTKIQLIENKSVLLKRGEDLIALGGVGDLWEDDVDIAKAFAGVPPSMPRILLSHNPDVAESYKGERTRVDLQISGHTHGGQVVLPGIVDFTGRVSNYGSKFNRGLVTGAIHRVYVTKGLCKVRGVRFFAPPDVTLIKLIRA